MTHRHKPQPTDLELFAFSKTAPQAIDLEQAVLGALMMDNTAWGIVEDTLTPDCFYTDAHKEIFGAIMQLTSKSHPVDLLTVVDQLKKDGAKVDLYYPVELTNRVASAANIEYHSKILKQKAVQRTQIEVCNRGLREAYNDTVDPFESLEILEQNVFQISNGLHSKASSGIGAFAIDALKAAYKAGEQKGLSGVPSGLQTVDMQTGGWQNTDLIILAARPGMGKTSFAMQCALHAAPNGFPTQVFSLEMSGMQLTQRVIAQLAGVSVQSMRTGKLTERELQSIHEATESLQSMPLYIDDTAGITISELRSKARKAVASKGVKFIIVDYIQLMNDNTAKANGNREQEISGISRKLKALAKELNVPVIALSQLSRAVETRGGSKRPQLSDLRESGSLEQDADAVVFLYRPEYYQIFEDETGASVKGQCEAIFGKHRNGAVGTCDENLGFDGSCTKFYNLSETQYAIKPQEVPVDPMPNIINNSRRMPDEDIPF